MLDLFPVIDPGTHVPPDGTLEDFEQETEEGAGEGGVPAAFGGFVADEGVLGLDFEELWEGWGVSEGGERGGEEGEEEGEKGRRKRVGETIRTERGTLASSRVLRMKSRPSRGTWVSFIFGHC